MNRGRLTRIAIIAPLCALAVSLASTADARLRRDRALEDRLRDHIAVLASDEYGGRKPGTPDETKTLRYLGRQWIDLGLVSGTNDPGNEWFAPVTLVAREPAVSVAMFRRGPRTFDLSGEDALMLTSGKRSLIRDAPLLFVGNSDVDSLSRNELAGRIAVTLGSGAQDRTRQTRLLAAGASAVLTVLEGSSQLAEVVAERRRSGYSLLEDSVGGDLQGFVTTSALDRILAGTGITTAKLDDWAAAPAFAPRRLPVVASLEATTRETTVRTHNLIGKLPGKRPDLGAVLLVAHWDHFGTCAEPPAEDLICNGAIDNASGLAVLTEIARRLARGPRPDRDIYFLATTAEELGLLGAHAFAENPPLPLSQIVAAFNIDSVAIAPSGTPLAIVGRGMTGLDEAILEVARRERRRVSDGDEPNEYVRRQDGWALLQHDIPAVMVTSAYGEIERMRAFFDTHYHKPSDDLQEPIELGGAAEDVAFHVALARWFADSDRFSPGR